MRGYITVALGDQKYYDMAANLARSIKKYDRVNPVCLIHDGLLYANHTYRTVFDDNVVIPPKDNYIGCLNKLRLYEYSPYEKSMFVDADCLMVRAGIDIYWRELDKYYFTMTGEKVKSGKWYNMDITEAMRILAIPYIVRMNSGVFYFKKSPDAAHFFKICQDLVAAHANILSTYHQARPGQWADEPFFGAAMGICGLDPIGSVADNSWMVTTWRSSGFRYASPDGGLEFKKHRKFLFGISLLPYSYVVHRPIFAHFISLRPKSIYRELANKMTDTSASLSSPQAGASGA